jgi:hypothetical protein
MKNRNSDDFLNKIGTDATAMFDNSASNPTERASSEATNAATTAKGEDNEDERLKEEDDDAAELEEDEEENEEINIEDEAGL